MDSYTESRTAEEIMHQVQRAFKFAYNEIVDVRLDNIPMTDDIRITVIGPVGIGRCKVEARLKQIDITPFPVGTSDDAAKVAWQAFWDGPLSDAVKSLFMAWEQARLA